MSLANLAGYASIISTLEDLQDSFSSDGGGVVVGTNVKYAPHQEFGTKYQQGTPHVRPAVERVGKDVERLAESADSTDDLLLMLGLAIEGEIKARAPVDTGNLRASYRTEKL